VRKRLYLMAVSALAVSAMPVSPAASASRLGHATKTAPNVRCQRLDIVEHRLRRLHFHVVERGGGLFGIVVRRDWVVVHESQSGNTVTLTAGRYC
jgi:hypothetical protein